MEHSKLQDRCRGSLLCGAVGDALGYEVEFMSLPSIVARFGGDGITRYELYGGVAQFSDDTQMTLFTAEGLLIGAFAARRAGADDVLPYIAKAYLAWYRTQTEPFGIVPGSWLARLRPLWARRAPGNTCLGALAGIDSGRGFRNDSKGCGGVMRVSPVGIFNAAHGAVADYRNTALLAGRAAEITHLHIASTFASALLAVIVENCIRADYVGRHELCGMVDDGLSVVKDCFPGHDAEWVRFRNLMLKAIDLGMGTLSDRLAIRSLGEGWVGDEALAIAVFCAVRHIGSVEDCVVCAVNHDGDSDSTGAIAGNIIGSIHGYSGIPRHYLDDLEMEPVLVSIADDLCSDIADKEVCRRLSDRYERHYPASVNEIYL